MLTASPLFVGTLKQSHQALTRAILRKPNATVRSGFHDEVEFTVTSGSLNLDGTRNVWRTASLELAPLSSVDLSTLQDIDTRSRIRIERGIRFPSGAEEWVVVGNMQVTEAEIDNREATVRVTAVDMGGLIEDYGLITPYVPKALDGTWLTTVEAIKDLVNTAIVWDQIPAWHVDATLDLTVKPVENTVFSGSRWEAIKKLAESLGAVVHVGVDGSWHIKAAATSTTVVETFATGNNGTIVNFSKMRSRIEQYNAVPLRWETPTIGGLVFMVDNDPASPTYWNGPFGRRPRDEETNDTIKTEQQAIDAATALLDQYKGRAASLSFTAVHNPLLEPMDVIEVKTRKGVEVHVIDAINYPLAGGVMSCTTRLIRETP